ncbi:recombinase family protein [Nocardioides sp. GCM10028917]|uniref:recombinase family protein n=1 Tax=Nocardioides sp. GCM10028917 TaxID=3273408 RepID=UPI00361E44A7
MTKRSVVLYARISVSTEESVSVARQIAAGRKYAAARDWRVVCEFVDDGVSATHNKPERRPAWRRLLASQVPFEAVVVWKVDRLARRVIDFLHADETLQARGAAIVCVEQSIDMTTGEGRAFAQMLAVFGEMEAAAISSRITAAREHLVSEGRIPGGRQPFGWRSVPNPDGPGFVRDQDPEQIEWVRGMVERVMRGDTVYSVTTWLNKSGAPGPRTRRDGRPWGYSSVNVLMRNPVLAGMFPIHARRGFDLNGFPHVRRNEKGEPIIAADGLISVEDFQALLHAITHKPHPSARHRHGSSSPLLALLVQCLACDRRLVRHHAHGKLTYWCPVCGQVVSAIPLTDFVVQRLLAERGSQRMFKRVLEVPENPAAAQRLAVIEHDLKVTALALTEDRADADTRHLSEEVARLKRARFEARRRVAGQAFERLTYVGTVKQVWEQCADDSERNAVLASQIETLAVSKAVGGPKFNADRVHLSWNNERKPIAPVSVPVGPIQRRASQPGPWISYRDASRLSGSSEGRIRRGIKTGLITRRKAEPGHPSLNRKSVIAFLRHDGIID